MNLLKRVMLSRTLIAEFEDIVVKLILFLLTKSSALSLYRTTFIEISTFMVPTWVQYGRAHIYGDLNGRCTENA